ncbi:MAG: D-2-hydroxyacid dehydrogenase family protein [Burkholderiales bacterium]
MKIAVLHDYGDMFRQARAFAKLKDHEVIIHRGTETDPLKLADLVGDADALVLTQQRVKVPRAAIERMPKLKFIAQTGRNAYHLDVDACTERGVVVSFGGTGPGGSNFASTVELTWAMIIGAWRHLPFEVERLKQGHWQSTVGTSLFGRTLGIYAYGHIGSAVARIGRAFGMKGVCWGREGSTSKARADGYEVAASREAFYADCDVISLHLPANKDTYGIVTAEDLARMKRTAMMVNTSRAPLIGKGVLAEALKKNRPGFGAVDVYDEEPLVGANDPVLKLPNALCTPHLGYNDFDAFDRFYEGAAAQLLAFAEGKPISVLNPEALKKK